jgi:hypothetical protein
MPHTKSRVVGSGFTTLTYRGQPIAFMASFADSGQRPVGGLAAVYELGKRHATEIATGRVLELGNLTLSITELWNSPVWQHLAGLEGTGDIMDVWERISADPTQVTAQMVIKPPGSTVWRGKIYYNCTVTAIDDSDTVEYDRLVVQKNIVVHYTHTSPFTMSAGVVTR